MLKRSISIFLLLAMISGQFSRVFVYAGFELNKSFIVKELCENRSRPELNCNGKCFLKKKLQAAEEKERKQERESQRNRYQETLPPRFELPTPFRTAKLQTVYPIGTTQDTIERPSSIFQPPKVA